MNALMTINVRVIAGTALAQLQAVDRTVATTQARARAGFGLPWLSKWGNQVQWAGRQLMYNFTLPLAIAGVAATKWGLDNEKAMTRVAKVYGDGSKQFNRLAKTELPALADAFEALSNRFGVAQADVINIGADWAAAGASGIQLAKATEITLRTMVLGEIEAATATKQLIAIQAQYGQSVGKLSNTIDVLNMVENQTGASMADLMDGMSRASGVARTAGVDVEHLAAMIAALTPAAGSAATAGNGIKTIISRILAPTKEASDLLGELGFDVQGLGWNSLTATQRLNLLAKEFDNLSDAQKNVMATTLGSRWQLNRFLTLMRAVRNENSYYNKSLRATADETRVFKVAQRELNLVLKSNPQRVKQAWTIIKNSATDAISGLLPYISYLASEFAKLTQKLSKISPEWQKLILFTAIFIALVGPLTRYLGSLATLFAILARAIHLPFAAILSLGSALKWLVKAPFALVAAGVGKLAGIFTGFATWAGAGFGKKFVKTFVGAFKALGRIMLIPVALLKVFIQSWNVTYLLMYATAQSWSAALLTLQKAWTSASLVLWGVWSKITTFAWVSTFVGMSNALYAWIAGLAGTLRTVPLLFSAMFMGIGVAFRSFIGILASARIAQYVWTVLMVEQFKVFIFRVGTLFTLLPFFIGRAISALYVFATVPGVLSGLFLRGWSAMLTAAGSMFASFGAALTRIWAFILVGFAKISTAFVTIWRAVQTALVTMSLLTARAIVTAYSLLVAIGPLIFKLMINPWVLAVAAILAAVYLMRDKVIEAWNWIADGASGIGQAIAEGWHNVIQSILDGFYALPQGVQDALIAVLNTVRSFVIQIYEWMSYLNPFARHSPSLVDNVTRGMDVIVGQYGRLSAVSGVFKKAYADLARYKQEMGSLGEFADNRRDVVQAGGNVALFDSMIGDLKKLYPLLKRQEAAFDAQSRVVDNLQNKLDEASYQLDKLTNAYNKHQDALNSFANAPLKGMQAMEDQIFSNEMAQKKLRLEMLRWEKTHGSIDETKNRLAALAGEIEVLRGHANDLRMAGAGSEVLGPLNAQLAAMEAQYKKLYSVQQNSPITQMQSQLDELQRQGEILDLEKSLQFDPLTRKIQELADTQKELTFDQIVAGIEKQRKAMEALQPALNAAQRRHDALQKSYDVEKHKLDLLDNQYSKTRDLVNELESALRSMGSAAAAANSKASKSASAAAKKASDAASKAGVTGSGAAAAGKGPGELTALRAGKGGNWPDPGGFKGITRKNMEDQAALVEEFADLNLKKMNKIMSKLNPFAPLKEWWDKTWTWIKAHVTPYVEAVINGYKKVFDAAGKAFGGSSVFNKIKSGTRKVVDGIKKIWDEIAPEATKIWNTIKEKAQKAWDVLGPDVERLFNTIKDYFKEMWPIVQPILKFLGITLIVAIKGIMIAVTNFLGPALDMIIGILDGVIQVITGFVNIVKAAFTGDLPALITGLKDVFVGAFKVVIAVLVNAGKMIWGVVKSVFEFFSWLLDKLIGHSVIPDLIKGILKWFKKLITLAKWVWDKVLHPIVKFAVKMFNLTMDVFKAFWPAIKTAWKILWTLGKWLWEHVLQPAWDKIKHLWELAKPELAKWWERVKAVWNALKALGRWVWDNVLKPAFDRIKSLWDDHVKPELAKWWDRITTVWNALKALGGWIKREVMDPIFGAIKEGWEKVRTWLSDNKDMLTGPAEAIVNTAIRAVNGLIGGLNAISNALPGIDFHINTITLLAQGGNIPEKRVGNGFKTSGARAIVGEGKANWPEFVIPTDPTYRVRARVLMGMVADKIGMPGPDTQAGFHRLNQTFLGGVPQYGLGGWIGDIAKGAWNKLKGLPKNAATKIWQPFRETGAAAINKVNWNVPRYAAAYGLEKMTSWVTMTNDQFMEAMKKADQKYGSGVSGKGMKAAVTFAKSQAGKPYIRAGVGPDGYDCSGFMSAITNVIRGEPNPYQRVGSTATFPWGGFVSGVDPQGFTIGSTPNYGGSGIGHMAGTLGNMNVESSGGVGVRVGSGARGYNDSGFSTIAHITKAAQGAIVKATQNGSLLRAGEGRYDEAIVPLPKNWRTDAFSTKSGGDTVININGNLEFPNISDGNDAKEFITNLKILAKGAA